MWWFIIGIFLLIFSILLLKGTEVEVWKHVYSYSGSTFDKVEVFNIKLPIWSIILMFILFMIPYLNISAFIVGMVIYVVYSLVPPDEDEAVDHRLSLNNSNFLVRILKIIKEILIKEI